MSTDLASSRRLEARAAYSFVTCVTFVKVKIRRGRECRGPFGTPKSPCQAQDRQLLLERLWAFRRRLAIASFTPFEFIYVEVYFQLMNAQG